MVADGFTCDKCGACCKVAVPIATLPTRDDGACSFLGADNLCLAYEARPMMCRSKIMIPASVKAGLFKNEAEAIAVKRKQCESYRAFVAANEGVKDGITSEAD